MVTYRFRCPKCNAVRKIIIGMSPPLVALLKPRCDDCGTEMSITFKKGKEKEE